MTIPPISLTPVDPTELASRAEVSGPSMDAALQEFEGIFVSMMLKEMRKSVGEGFFGGDKADAIGGLFDMTIGEELGRSGGLGIADALARYQQVTATMETSRPNQHSGESK